MTDPLLRLRKHNNALLRRLNELENQWANELRRRDGRIKTLESELAAIKDSRVMRTARRLRRLLPNGRAARGAGTDLNTRAHRYQEYVRATSISESERKELTKSATEFRNRPLISIVMPVHNVVPRFLDLAIGSVLGQIYDRWELCLVDDASNQKELTDLIGELSDPRIRAQMLEQGAGISGATNRAISSATGEYLAFMDHDDELAPEALFEIVSAVNDRNPDLIYTDEDCIDPEGNRQNPHFKPDYSPDLLLSHNYMTHLLVVRRELLEATGGLRSDYDGAQDYDFVLRATEQTGAIHHVPRVLYHWRLSESSTSMNADSKPLAAERGRKAIEAALERRSYGDASVYTTDVPHFYRVCYAIRNDPVVSIVIPFKDRADLLQCVIGDILERSTYGNYEVVGVSNNSVEPETFDAMEDLSAMDSRVRFLEHDVPFNFPALVNVGAAAGRGDYLVSLNNDIRILTDTWIEEMLGHSQRPETGAVGGKLYYPDDRVQHAGVIIGIGEYAGHSHKGFPADHQGYFNRLQVIQNVSAVTGAFMMVRHELFDAVGGFDEEAFPVACNDVDFCLRLRERGVWNVFTPYAQAYHLESASRGYEDSPEKKARYAAERARFMERHGWIFEQGDPCYNPNLTRDTEDFNIRSSGGC